MNKGWIHIKSILYRCPEIAWLCVCDKNDFGKETHISKYDSEWTKWIEYSISGDWVILNDSYEGLTLCFSDWRLI